MRPLETFVGLRFLCVVHRFFNLQQLALRLPAPDACRPSLLGRLPSYFAFSDTTGCKKPLSIQRAFRLVSSEVSTAVVIASGRAAVILSRASSRAAVIAARR